MTDITDIEMHGLINALQLCIQSPLTHYIFSKLGKEGNTLRIGFSQKIHKDSGLKKLEQLMPGKWEYLKADNQWDYVIEAPEILNISALTNFLLLTRLQDEQIIALASQDARFRSFAETLGLVSKEMGVPISTLSDMRDIIFKTIDQKKLSLKTVAELTGLSQVSLSNFKAGKDIRFSTLLKLTKALGIKVSLG